MVWAVRGGPGRAAGRVVVDRVALRRATYTLRELTGDYGAVLERVVEAPGPWAEGVRAVLEALKPAVHRGEPPPEPSAALAGLYGARAMRRARRLAAERGHAGEVVRALLWSHATEPAGLEPALEAFAALRADLVVAVERAADPLRLALDSAALAADEGSGGLRPLVDVLRDPAAFGVPTSAGDFASRLTTRLASKRRPPARERLAEPPAASLGPALAAWAGWLLGQPSAARQRGLGLLALLDPPASLAAWSAWWARVTRAEGRARRALALGDQGRQRHKVERVVSRLRRLDERRPAPLSASALTGLLSWYARDADAGLYAAAAGALRALGPEPHALAFLAHWRELSARAGAAARHAVAGFERYLALTASLGPKRLRPWAGVLKGKAGAGSLAGRNEVELLGRGAAPSVVARFYAALAACGLARGGDLNGDAFDWLVELAAVDAPPAAVAAVASRAGVDEFAGRYLDVALVRGAFEAARADAPAALSLLKGVAGLDDDDGRHALRPLRPLLDAGRAELALAILGDPALAPRLVACGRALEWFKLDGAAVPLPRADGAPPWVERYPAGLRPALAELASVDADAEASAERLLRDDFPRDEALRSELAAARERLASRAGPSRERLGRRIENLAARLGGANRAGPRRLERCRERVERATRAAIVEGLRRATSAAAERFVRELVSPAEPPAWLFEPATAALLMPVAGLDAGGRALAARVLRARLGPPPWDLRDEPANRAFLERLARLGVATAPWLEGPGRARVRAESGAAIDLWLEDDPLRVFEMGAHFQTCLTPGRFNYFSVFANAADVNKRVLYAADEGGTIVGRCLLALTAEGGLVAFHPYAHARALGFERLVERFASSLAAAMGTELLPRGKVPRLVAHDWYDDGPVDLGGRFDFLQEDSPFRRSLGAIDPATFAAALAEQFRPLAFNELTLPLVLELPEVHRRPELAEPLLPLAARLEALPPEAAANVTRLAVALGRPDLVDRRLLGRFEDHLVARHAAERWLDADAARILLDLDPARALAALRTMRGKGARSWDDCAPAHVALAAEANERLFRPRRALALYETASRGEPNAKAKAAYERRARALRERLAAR